MEIESRPSPNELFELERGNARALHEQLSDRLKLEFISTYSTGQQIPTEETICQNYGLSRVTVRRAIQTLVDQGLLIRRQGKGTFLAQPKPRITYQIDRLGPFMDAFASSNEPVSARLIDFRWATGKEIPECFSGESSVLVYERLYETAGTPHGFLQITMPALFGDRISKADTAKSGVYQILRERIGVEPFRASFNIGSELPDAILAAHLGVSPTTPLLTLERISYDVNDVALERTIHHLLPEVYKLSVRVSANSKAQKSESE
jgi:GntR family transcriptional regulator